MSSRAKNTRRISHPTNQHFFIAGLLKYFLLYIFLVVGYLSYSLYWIYSADRIVGVVDTYIHTAYMNKHGRNVPTTHTVIGFHDENNVYQRFTSTMNLALPERTEMPVLYKSSPSGSYTAMLELSAYMMYILKIALSLVPLVFFILAYGVHRNRIAPDSIPIIRESLVLFLIMEVLIFCSGYLWLIGYASIPVLILCSIGILIVIGKSLRIVEKFQMRNDIPSPVSK